jgi:F-type H+-transporting ATPase subunit delta
MKPLTKNARDFVDDIVRYVKTDVNSQAAGAKVRSALTKITADVQSGNVAVVETAVDLSETEKNELRRVLEIILNHPVSLTIQAKPDMLGGIRIAVGDWVYDASLSNQLKQIQSHLIESL